MPSTYPDNKWTRHRTPRGIKAAEWSCMSTASYDAMQYGLAASLVPYVSGDDVALSRVQFLRTVVSRILDDLAYRTE